MGLVHLGLGEVALVGGDEGNAGAVGERDEAGFDGLFGGQAEAVQFHGDAVGEGFAQAVEERAGGGHLAFG